MSYRDPLDAARARIAALEDLLDSERFLGPGEAPDERRSLREARSALAEERAEHTAEIRDLHRELSELRRKAEDLDEELLQERARRQAEVSLLRSKLEEAERAIQNNASVFESEQTIQRAQAEADGARLRQTLVEKETMIRELKEEVRVHLAGDRRAIRAHYEARVRAVGTELAEHGTLARLLEEKLPDAKRAIAALPPVDVRDREAMVERELAKRKLAIGEAELERVRARLVRLEEELERITHAEADLAERDSLMPKLVAS